MARRRSTARNLPRLLPLALLAMSCCAGGSAFAQAAAPGTAGTTGAEQRKSYRLPAGPLGNTLADFAAESGVSITIAPELVRGRTSPSLQGVFSVREGFARLLAGSGMDAVGGTGGAYVLRAGPTVDRSAPAATLAPVTVLAQADVSTTEGTGSYGTRSTSTATRLTLSQRETPQSVSVITRQQMDDQGLTNLPEVLEKTVGVTVGRNDSERATFYARGFSIENFQFDGVPNTLDSANQYTTAMADSAIYDRVEVVKGATGLLTGAGNPSATINLVRKKPTRDFQASISAGAGSWDKYRGSADLSGKLNESGSVRGRIVAAGQNANSYVNYYGRDTRNLYGIVEVDLAPQTLLSVGVDHMESKAKGASYGHLPLFFSDGGSTRFSRSLNPAARWSYWNNDSTNLFSTLKHEFGNGWKLDLTASRLKQGRDVEVGVAAYGSLDATTGQGLNVLSAKIPTQARTNAVNAALSGPFELFGREHELSLGLGWSRQKRTAPGYTSGYDPAGNYFAWDGNFSRPDFELQNIRKTTIAEKGAFGAVRLKPLDGLSVILGTRVSWYKLDDGETSLAGVYSATETVQTNGKAVPYAGVVYDIDRQLSVYASYTDIFNPQTYYKDSAQRAIAPLTGKSGEVGVKGEFLDRRLFGSVALFEVRQKNAAQYIGSNLATGNEIYTAVDGITSKGLEVEVAGQVTPSWNIAGGYTFRRSKIPQQPDAILSAVNTNQPKHLFKVNTSYRLPGALNRLVVGGSLSWQSDTYYQTSDGTGYRADQPAYALVGLMARYEFDRHLSVAVNVNNLFDKTYMPGLGSYGTGVYGDPRNVLVTANYRF